MFTVITGAEVYAPQPLGIVDVLIVGERIAAVGKDLARGLGAIGAGAEVIDLTGRILTPGLIDGHYHPLGGGDYEGPLGRVTDIELGDIVRSGITTAVGVLGSDYDARNLNDLFMKSRELQMGGITAFFYTGSFFLPPVTLTGAVRRDIMVVESCIGVKFAISEEMAFNDEMDMAKVAVEGVHGGSLAGKPGVVHMHVGERASSLDPLFAMIERTGLPAHRFYPTHINRSDPDHMKPAAKFVEMGGTIDLTAIMCPRGGSGTGVRIAEAFANLLNLGVPVERITFTSDGNVSMPIRNERREQIGLFNAGVDFLLDEWRDTVRESGLPFEQMLLPVTINPARVLKMSGRKGCIAAGADADLVAWDDALCPQTVIARGKTMLHHGELLVKGPFER
jgi:beta-aspartyl-dipeptidase (metallo-type)